MGIFSSKKPEAKQHYIKDKQLKCHHCHHDMFHERRSTLPQPPASFSDWGQRHTICYECTNCGYIQWFVDKEAKW